MEKELLKTFDENGNARGTATRAEVHREGHWHETFHCWFTEKIGDEHFIFFQVRSSDKKDYPNLLDITAAGHILAEETHLDGLREVKEELGIEFSLEDLKSLGVIKDSLKSPGFLDNELCHVFLYDKHIPFDHYDLQREEVSGIMMTSMSEFINLWSGKTQKIKAEGFLSSGEQEKKPSSLLVTKRDFVPHEDSYIYRVIEAMKNS